MLGLKFQFDESLYAVQTPENYFHAVSASSAAEELARLQENITDAATTDSWEEAVAGRAVSSRVVSYMRF